MNQHIYEVQVIDKAHGREQTLRVWAQSAAAARNAAAEAGLVAGEVRLVEIRSSAASGAGDPASLALAELPHIRSGLSRITESRVFTRPRYTIADGMLLGAAYCAAAIFVVWLAINAVSG